MTEQDPKEKIKALSDSDLMQLWQLVDADFIKRQVALNAAQKEHDRLLDQAEALVRQAKKLKEDARNSIDPEDRHLYLWCFVLGVCKERGIVDPEKVLSRPLSEG